MTEVEAWYLPALEGVQDPGPSKGLTRQAPDLVATWRAELRPFPTTFYDFAEKKVIPFIKRHLITARRVDVIWDRYLLNSLKATSRESRGDGVRQPLPSDGNGKIPKNWNSYLRNSANKIELFHYLSRVIARSAFG